MGQILSLRKSSSIRSHSKSGVAVDRNNKRLRGNGSACASAEIPTVSVDYGKGEGHARLSTSDHLVATRSVTKINGPFEGPTKSDKRPSKDTNNNYQLRRSSGSIDQPSSHVTATRNDFFITKSRDANRSSNGGIDGREGGVLTKPFNGSALPAITTHPVYEGYNHSSSPKSSLRTCHLKNYCLDSSKSLYSEPTVQSEPARRHHQPHNRHHRRRKGKSSVQHNLNHQHHNHHHQHFGYDIRNVEEFLSECSLLSPANIPVVLSSASILYQTRPGFQLEIPLPLGMVVNGVFKIQQWLYVQTPHAEEGYVAYEACLPLGILPTTRPPSLSRSRPEGCWETTDDVYPKPYQLTDSDQEYLTRSARSEGARTPNCSEKNVDTLYLKAAASQSNLNRTYSQVQRQSPRTDRDRGSSTKSTNTPPGSSPLIRETLLAVQINYKSSAVSVKKGDVVTLLACKEIRDNHSKTPRQWFYIRTRNGTEAFIPAEVAGHGFL